MNKQKLGMITAVVVAVVCMVLLVMVNINNGYDRTQAPAAVSTDVPTEEPTIAPTAAPTEKPTIAPTAVPTEKPTAVPTEKPTVAPTIAPTAAPTEKPTAAPTEKPTAAPTEKPTAVPTNVSGALPQDEAGQTPEAENDSAAAEIPKANGSADGGTKTAGAAGETAAESPVPGAPTATPEVSVEPTQLPVLYGRVIGIDPGHQAQGNSQKEAIAPGSSEKKAKVSSGTSGRFTGIPEYVTNLEVSLQLRDALEALGATVVMSRETHDVDISNQERAIMMNEAGCDLVLRIHCNGAENASAQGIGLYIRKTGTCAEECAAAAELLLPAMVKATGAESDGIFKRDTYTGLNWSEVPCILVEMGFMTNKEEDEKLNDPAYQKLLVEGMVDGVVAYLGAAAE